MPLDNYFPVIDDRRYDDIMTEVRTRIARYTPEWNPVWSDVNDNDPGITLVQVFAWLSEMMLYRMGQVPKLNYLKFLQLLGIDLQPAEPARAEITFPVTEKHPSPTVIVPARTQVASESPDGGPPIIFETERTLVALSARLASVQIFDGNTTFQLVTAQNEATGQGFQPFDSSVIPGRALYLGFDSKQDLPQVDLDLTFWTMDESAKVPPCQCGLPASPAYPPARLIWECWNGSGWQSLAVLKDETLALTRSGHVYLKLKPLAASAKKLFGSEKASLFWVGARVEQSQYERPPKLRAVRINTVAAQQAEIIRDEVLGGSNGRRNQVFTLANSPVLRGFLRLEVDEGVEVRVGEAEKVWTEVEDLFGSTPADHHYVLNRTTGQIRFGDGVNGAIPVRSVTNPDMNVVAREYRVGGGTRGNLPAGAIKTLVTPVAGVDENGVANLLAAHSGRNEETIEEAQKRAPRSIKSRCRAVTAEDFELFAREAANVKRAKALPLAHPNFPFPEVKVPGVVTVIVVPDADPAVPNPLPSEGTLRTVCAYLDQRRLLTTEVYVISPTYQEVTVEAAVVARDDADLAEIKEEAEKALYEYFHPLKGGEDGQGWPFGGDIYYSRVYQRVFKIPGVQSIASLKITVGNQTEDCRDIPIKDGILLYSTQHTVTVRYEFEA